MLSSMVRNIRRMFISTTALRFRDCTAMRAMVDNVPGMLPNMVRDIHRMFPSVIAIQFPMFVVMHATVDCLPCSCIAMRFPLSAVGDGVSTTAITFSFLFLVCIYLITLNDTLFSLQIRFKCRQTISFLYNVLPRLITSSGSFQPCSEHHLIHNFVTF